ncbi:phosphate regulon transcriptional regulator PhoB [Candidatus Rariloculus sp.]|uniref:phosphate regulon transcriptional regulator PhoB n=1 Tax=Candidatus Rariloculus sp. TaxID=3101265 RepID=UPI003D1160A8
MSQKTVLVVEDERPIRDMLAFNLGRAGYEVQAVDDGREARAAIANRCPDVVLMDWMLPDVSGLEFTRQLKRDPRTREIPVIMVTALADEDDRVTGLDAGADDYIVKPFSQRELLARIRAALRRGTVSADEVVTVGQLKLNSASLQVTVGEEIIPLSRTEYRLLEFFMRHPGRVYSRSQLLDSVWGGNVYVEERTVDVHIRRLRKALTPSGYDKLIRTSRGAGYCFSPREV